jgi:magnesium-transporting ATPase (P-type)
MDTRAAAPAAKTDWHALAGEQALRAAGTTAEGLDASEAEARLARHGPNRLPEGRKRHPLLRLAAQFNNLLILALIAAAAVAAALRHWIDALVILAVALVNAVIGYVQEGKAERALEAIGRMLAPTALALRQGQRVTLPAESLVPGDIVLIEAGDHVPADLRLLRCKNLQIQEAILTGESLPVEKSAAPVAAEALPADRRSMAYSGTLVASGQGTGLVVATGAETEIGRVGRLLARVEELTTPLLRQMNQFARWLTFAILAMAAVMFAFGMFARGIAPAEMFMAVVGLSVAAIPEGLPTILTVTLAIGVQRMAARRAIIRRLPAVETLGAVSVICSDKTGTLTRNEMTAQAVVTSRDVIAIGGVGYDRSGGASADGKPLDAAQRALFEAIARAGLLCSDATLRQTESGWIVDGDPMEGALVALAGKANLGAEALRRALPRTDEIPFDAQHRYMATLHHDHEGRAFVYLKGAPERVLDLCEHQRDAAAAAPLDRAYWIRRIDEIGAGGMRVIAIARKDVPAGQRSLSFADCERGFEMLGLVGFIDPPRPEAVEAVAECRRAGIEVKMITGDHAMTAGAIAAQLGLARPDPVVTGAELEKLDASELRGLVPRADVFARTSPEHKLRLVEALQAEGRIVAMTGDGVNDAPALKRADIGIAMGRRGTDAARQSSGMVLTDDNFASIVAAVREGRTVYDNLKKAILFLLPINGGEALTIMAAILLGYELPVTPLQILWVNMVSSVTLAMSLAFEPAEPGVMRRTPRPPREPLLTPVLVWRIALVSLLILGATATAFFAALRSGVPLETARTIAVNTLVACEVFYLFNVRYLSVPSLTLTGVRGTEPVLIAVGAVFLLQTLFTYAPFMNAIFHSRPLALVEGAATVVLAILMFALLEIEKALQRVRRRPRPAAP